MNLSVDFSNQWIQILPLVVLFIVYLFKNKNTMGNFISEPKNWELSNPANVTFKTRSEALGNVSLMIEVRSILDLKNQLCNIIDSKKSDFINSKTDIQVLLWFTAIWCNPCQSIKPLVNQLRYNAKCVFVKIDIDFADDQIKKHLSGVPTFMLFTLPAGKRPFTTEEWLGMKLIAKMSGANEKKLIDIVMSNCARFPALNL